MRRISFDTYDNYETSYSPELLITTFTGIKSLKRQKLILEEELTPCTILSGRYILDVENPPEKGDAYFVASLNNEEYIECWIDENGKD